MLVPSALFVAGLTCGGLVGGLVVGLILRQARGRAAVVSELPSAAPPAPASGDPLANPSAQRRHEIRTLVSSVVGMVDMLIEMPLADASKRWASLLHQSSQHLLDLVQGPKSVSRQEAAASTPAAEAAPADPAGDIASGVRKRVLVVEDNAVNQLVVLGYLKHYPVEVKAVLNGQEALDQLASSSYNLVLMDCAMPVMDGYEATRRIRASERADKGGTRLPIVAITANATLEDEAQCRAVGMDDYVTKPLRRETMVRVLQQWLH